MKIIHLKKLTIASICFQLFSAHAHAVADTQFYIFPVKEIEGLKAVENKNLRPLVDAKAVAFISGQQADAQKELLTYFNEQLIKTYGQSIIHVKQVRDHFKGPIKLVDDDNLNCDSVPTVSLQQAYGAVLGISRASFYQVDKGGVNELLIPVTLNLQVIKPDKAKIVFSTSNTTYTPFRFTDSEIGSEQYKATVKNAMVKSMKSQIDELVKTVQLNFNPKAMPVKIVGKDGPFFIADKGYEVGFKDGDEPSALDKDGKEVLFQVVNANDGYAVLKALGGGVQIGYEYLFTFETKADDSRKPRMMPVTTEDPKRANVNGVIDVFSKNIGFKAPFQLSAVDVNFTQTMNVIRERAQCVPWDKYPNSTTVKDSRTDVPQFIFTVDTGETAIFKQVGKNDTLTKETFATVVQGKVSDINGVIYGSAIGVDKYVLEKTAGIGLSSDNAKEVSLQNATKAMTSEFLKNIQFEPKVFNIKNVKSQNDGKGSLIVDNLPVDSGFEVTGTITRKLNTKVAGKETFVRLPITTEGQVVKIGAEINVPYQMSDIGQEFYKPKAGDSLVVYALPKGNAKAVDMCESEYIGKNNTVTSSFAKPLASNIILNSPKYQVKEMSSALVQDVNSLLDAGNFKDSSKLAMPQASGSCVQTGYLVREEANECNGSACKATTMNALVIKDIESGISKKDLVLARKSQLEGFNASQKDNYYSVNAFDEYLKIVPDLTKQLNGK